MQLANSKTGYGAVPQALHWLTAICVIAAWLLGQFHDVFPKGPPRAVALWMHITLGECVMIFLVARLISRIADPPPPFPPTPFGRLLEIASRVSHYTLYALLVVVPFVGIIVQLKRGNTLPMFGLEIASPWPADRATAHHSRSTLLSRQRASEPCRHSCRGGADAPLCVARPDAHAHAAGRNANLTYPRAAN